MKPRDAALVARIRAQIDDRRAVHPEMASPLTLAALRAVLARDGVEMVVRSHPRLAELIPILGRWTIIVDVSTTDAERLALVAHELGHLWLHHDPFSPRHETHVYDSGCPWYDEQREREANIFAELLVAGPVPVFAPSARRKSENQGESKVDSPLPPGVPTIPLELFEAAAERAKALAEESKRFRAEHRVVRRRKKAAASPDSLLTGRAVSLAKTADDEQIKFFDDARGLPRFRDDDGVHWWITNFDESGEQVRDFMASRITRRVFENAAGVRKAYEFRDRHELRAYKVKHLERQLREAQ